MVKQSLLVCIWLLCLSMLEGDLSKEDINRIQNLISKANLPTTIKKSMDSESLIKAMSFG